MAFPATRWGRRQCASSALPPLYYLHVWWARRPLMPSRAAIVASLAPWDMDPEKFVRELGIERVQALINDEPWTLTGELPGKVARDAAPPRIAPSRRSHGKTESRYAIILLPFFPFFKDLCHG